MSLVDLAEEAGRAFTSKLPRREQRDLGQYMTPAAIARFMARRLVADFGQSSVRILEPAAGTGVLAAAVVEELLSQVSRPEHIELLLYEVDARLLPALHELCTRMQETCAAAGACLSWRVHHEDFLLSELAISGQPVDGLLVISNPPFLKLNKSTDPRARAHAYAVWGQPNIYALFMAACARLIDTSGRWCFITPRSWMNGAYFTAARLSILRHLSIDGLHAFENRREGFEEDAVLQETVITWATGRHARVAGSSVLLTRSQGVADLSSAEVVALPMERVVGIDEQVTLSIPSASGDDSFASCSATLATYGLRVSTGPVIAFRAARFIEEGRRRDTVPLLWLQHVRQQVVSWPISKKREHIRANAETAWMLVRNQPMVLVRRFSPKEDERRVTCAPYGCGAQLPGHVIGLENHLNFIHRPGGEMPVDEVRGLSGYLASRAVDVHLRTIAGSTQVNAKELRDLPLPALDSLKEIGRRLSAAPSLAEIDHVVNAVLANASRARAAA